MYDRVVFASVGTWLIAEGRLLASPVALIAGLATRLAETGIAPIRINIQLQTLHPLVSAQLYVWRLGDAEVLPVGSTARVIDARDDRAGGGVVQQVSLGHGSFVTPAYTASPLARVYAGDPMVRCTLTAEMTSFDFPIVADLHAAGALEYLCFPMFFSSGRRGAISIATARNLSDAEVDAFAALVPAIAACMDVHLANHVARTLLDTYVGRRTGERVLAGRIRTGDVERLDAAIWFSDLRGFTVISGSIDAAELVAWLNAYFDAVCAPITARGGEILKFIGDAVLAVFPVEGDAAAACRAARAAAEEAHVALDALNARRAERGLPAMAHGIALHVGEVQYGNIGTQSRLDFTVIGPAVNLTSRLEGLCGKLARRTVTSSAFAALAGDGLAPLGTFDLKGIAEPQPVFG